MVSQWQCIQQNIGTWHGSFMQISPGGELVKDTPRVLTLEETELDKTMALTLERFPAGEDKKVNRLTFTAPGPAPTSLSTPRTPEGKRRCYLVLAGNTTLKND